MTKAQSDCLTEQHLLLFGTIIQWFARYEWLMQQIMAAAAGCDSGAVMLLTRGLDFSGKRQALFDLLRHCDVPLDRYDRINAFLMIPHTLTQLRNDIAHSLWMPGPSSDRIQPDWVLRLPSSIKPMRGEGLVETEQDKVAYSREELAEIVDTLAANYARFAAYVEEVGLIAV